MRIKPPPPKTNFKALVRLSPLFDDTWPGQNGFGELGSAAPGAFRV